MTRRKFSVREAPKDKTIFFHLAAETDLRAAIERVGPPKVKFEGHIPLRLEGIDLEGLRTSIVDAVATLGFQGWQSKDGDAKDYGGFSLMFNPDHQEALDPNFSSLGSRKNNRNQFFWARVEHHEDLKHSYFDSYGFRHRSPVSKHGMLDTFLNGFYRSLTRSRIGIIVGEAAPADSPTWGWHRDEPVFENCRINVPLQTDERFFFEVEGYPAVHLPVGKGYTWDTHAPHRVYMKEKSALNRIHVVVGLSPWFDYLPDEDAWQVNEFFGEMHPLDMIAEGHVHRGIRA